MGVEQMLPSEVRRNRLTVTGVVTAVLLFVLKLGAGLSSGSIAVISDALNSLFDIFTYTAMHISVRIQNRQPDDDHHFGHRRAEPLAGLLIAIFAGILGATLLKDALVSLFLPPQPIVFSLMPVVVLLFSIAVKSVLAWLYRGEARSARSPALHAGYIDSRNDVTASTVALIGFWIGGTFDSIAAGIIGGWILYSGVRVGLENIGYLMGKAPSTDVLTTLHREAASVQGVLGAHDLRAHYVGDRVHVEIHIEVDERLSARQAHDIAVIVQYRLERVHSVQTAFVHVDPVPTKEAD